MSAASAASGGAIEPWLLEPRLEQVMVELTTRCNLRCVYCAVSQPGYLHHDLELEPEDLARQVLALRPSEVQINGHGETTLIEGWHRVADVLIRRGIRLTLTTHFNKRLTDEEIELISRLWVLTISCDTADPALYAELRRGGRLERLQENLRRVREACARRRGRKPYVSLNCTLTHRNVATLPGLVHFAKAEGADAVSVTNLLEYPELPNADRARHPAEVDPAGALAALDAAAAAGRETGIEFNVMPGLRESLEAAIGRS